MTPAATIWIGATIGMAFGAGFYIISAVSRAITLALLILSFPVHVFSYEDDDESKTNPSNQTSYATCVASPKAKQVYILA